MKRTGLVVGLFAWAIAVGSVAEVALYDDLDGDGMLDAWELQIVDDNPTDGIETFYDVLRDGNYDGDAFSNIEEFLLGFDPVVPGGDPLDTVEEGLELMAAALTNEFDRVYASLIDGCFETVVATDPSNHAARVYRAASRLVNLLNQDGQDDFLEEFGIASSWDFEITGEFDIANAPLPDAVVDFFSTNLLPAIDASYADLEVIPTNWSGTAEISTNYFPVDETIYADIGDATAAMSMLKLLRSKVLSLAAQSLNVDYEKILMPVDGPEAAITLDGLTNDWVGIPVQLLGEYDSVVEYVKGARSASSIYLLVQLANAEIPIIGAECEIFLGVDSSVDLEFFPYWGHTNIWFSETETNTTEISVVSSNRTIEIEIPVPDGIAISNASIDWLDVEYLPVGAELWMSSWEELGSPFSSPVDVVLQNHPGFIESVRSPLGLSSAKTNLNEAIDLFQLANELILSRTDALMHFIEYDPTNETERVEFFNRLQQVESSLDSPQPVLETNGLGEVVFEQVVHLGAFYQPAYLTRSMLPEFWKIPSQPLDGTFPDPTFGGVLPGMTQYKLDEYLRRSGGVMDADGDGIPNGWEYLYCGHPTNCIAQLDNDNDGQSNYDEYISGMDPTNAASCFRAAFHMQDVGGSSDIVISWEAAEGRVYDVHWCPALDQDFQLLRAGINYPQNSYTDPVHGAEAKGFYKVDVQME